MYKESGEYTKAEVLENREIWLKALESGKYQQTTGVLAENWLDGTKKFCCLGVACHVLGVPDIREEDALFSVYDGSDGTLGHNTRKMLGLKDDEGMFKYTHRGLYKSLTALNDNAYLSFEEIAAFIRTNPEGLWEEDETK